MTATASAPIGFHEKLFIIPARPSDVKNAPGHRPRLHGEAGPGADLARYLLIGTHRD